MEDEGIGAQGEQGEPHGESTRQGEHRTSLCVGPEQCEEKPDPGEEGAGNGHEQGERVLAASSAATSEQRPGVAYQQDELFPIFPQITGRPVAGH